MAQTHLVAGGGIFQSDIIVQTIELPANVTQWYYSFSCNAEDGSGIILDLYNSLASEFSPAVGLAVNAVGLLTKPNGTETCTIYLLDADNYQRFANDEPFYCLKKNENIKSGIISEYRYIEPQKYYLVIYNTSIKKISVELEIVAVEVIE
ncbi:MAG: hypothetical protein J6U04_04625 [Salinivirgaceae bacterium]|nr:hypothetical protein [Salinivirgaceae bacterium]